METYKIAFKFKERNLTGYVQKFSDHYDVFFQDEEILQAYGGILPLIQVENLNQPGNVMLMIKLEFILLLLHIEVANTISTISSQLL